MEYDYIANCIHLAIMECAPSKMWQLSQELANAVRLAETEGSKAAHIYLQEIVNKASQGVYK